MTGARGTDGLGDVQPRIPRQSAREQDIGRPDDDTGLSAELVAVVGAARRRAVRDGDRQIDTAHLLHTLLESDPEVREAFGGGPPIVRLLGYLVQRSIGYGLRWQTGVEDSGALPVVNEAAVAEAGSAGVGAAEAEGWSPVASAALVHARALAARRGDEPARGTDLLSGIVADPGARAVEVLARAGIDARELAAGLRRANGGESGPGGESGTPGAGTGSAAGAGFGTGAGPRERTEQYAGDGGPAR
ncbi:Clp protease N-terminal domain-containing protein [Streptomyces sp. NPDC056160]|uniref:Clp protease N-terminal domain-containing protein n=1 Tax=Streptomyces sp. NPDC056160 TaxID=3345731 RepID=UPI0035DFCE1A